MVYTYTHNQFGELLFGLDWCMCYVCLGIPGRGNDGRRGREVLCRRARRGQEKAPSEDLGPTLALQAAAM